MSSTVFKTGEHSDILMSLETLDSLEMQLTSTIGAGEDPKHTLDNSSLDEHSSLSNRDCGGAFVLISFTLFVTMTFIFCMSRNVDCKDDPS